MNKHSIVNLKCPCFLFRYPNLDIPSQALFNLPIWCVGEEYQNFQSPPGHSRRPVRRCWYCKVLVCHSVQGYKSWSWYVILDISQRHHKDRLILYWQGKRQDKLSRVFLSLIICTSSYHDDPVLARASLLPPQCNMSDNSIFGSTALFLLLFSYKEEVSISIIYRQLVHPK